MDDLFKPKKRKPAPVRERDVEKDHRLGVKATGGLSLKFKSPGYNGVPDRLDLYGDETFSEFMFRTHGLLLNRKQAMEAIAAAITFTELKAPGKEPTDVQHRVHQRLRLLGFTVNVVDQKAAK